MTVLRVVLMDPITYKQDRNGNLWYIEMCCKISATVNRYR